MFVNIIAGFHGLVHELTNTRETNSHSEGARDGHEDDHVLFGRGGSERPSGSICESNIGDLFNEILLVQGSGHTVSLAPELGGELRFI